MKKLITNPSAPAAASSSPIPLSPALDTGSLVFLSGQVGVDPATGTVAGPDVTSQTRQTLENIKALLGAAGLGMEHVVKTTVFLTNTEDFRAMNDVYREFFPAPFPTRSTIGTGLANPAFVVEIEAIALRGA